MKSVVWHNRLIGPIKECLCAYVIMPDHVHILLKPINNGISKTMQLIKGRASRHINQGNLWQKGFFDFMILTEEKFKEKR